MNREIKFRAWDINEEVMMYDNDKEITIQFQDGKAKVTYIEERHTVRDGIDIDYPCVVECTDFELMQFVGKKDKNGKDIYEGDWIKRNDGVIKCVFYNENQVGYYTKFLKGGGFVDSLRYATDRECEVIGNIYENPELLTP